MTRSQLRWLLTRPWPTPERLVLSYMLNDRTGDSPYTVDVERLSAVLHLKPTAVAGALSGLARRKLRGRPLVLVRDGWASLVFATDGAAPEPGDVEEPAVSVDPGPPEPTPLERAEAARLAAEARAEGRRLAGLPR